MSGHQDGGHALAESDPLWRSVNEDPASRRSQNKFDHHRSVGSKSRSERTSCMQPVTIDRAMISMIGSMPNEKSTAPRGLPSLLVVYTVLSIS